MIDSVLLIQTVPNVAASPSPGLLAIGFDRFAQSVFYSGIVETSFHRFGVNAVGTFSREKFSEYRVKHQSSDTHASDNYAHVPGRLGVFLDCVKREIDFFVFFLLRQELLNNFEIGGEEFTYFRKAGLQLTSGFIVFRLCQRFWTGVASSQC